MNFVPLDQTDGLTLDEIALLRALRYSDGGRLLLRVLTEAPPPRTVLGPDSLPHNDSYLLGRREAYDDLVRSFRMIGREGEPLPSLRALPKYSATPRKKDKDGDSL